MPKKDRDYLHQTLQYNYKAGIHNPARLAHMTGMTRQGVTYSIQRYNSTGSFRERHRSGRRRLLSEKDETVLREIAASGFFGSAAEWVMKLKEKTGRVVSPRTMCRALHLLEFTYRTPEQDPLTPKQREDRIRWCESNKGRDWSRAVFLDEFTVDKERAKNRYWILKGVTPKLFARKKFAKAGERVSMSFLAAFTLKGFVGCFPLPKNFTAAEFRQVLNVDFLPAVTALLGHRWILVLDNDGRHRTSLVSEWITAQANERLFLPSLSPDLNPIENLFSVVKQKLEARHPSTKKEIMCMVQEVWKEYSERNVQQAYIQSMPDRCLEVVKAKGARTDY
jgi:transposase